LAIVPDELWHAVQYRIKTVNTNFTSKGGVGLPDSGKTSRFLLTGIARCGCCGGSVVSVGGKIGKGGKELLYYKCSYRHKRGAAICENSQTVRVKPMEDAVLSAIETNVLNPEITLRIINRAVEMIRNKQEQDSKRPARLAKEIQKIERELSRFMDLIASGKAPDSILNEITLRENKINALKVELDQATIPVSDELDERRLKKALTAHMSQFKDLMYSDTMKAKRAIKTLLDGALIVKPLEKGWHFEGKTKLGPLLDPSYTKLASPRGFEPLLPP
jgi:site-specific DNA recombinase